jgi:hypothetical protein
MTPGQGIIFFVAVALIFGFAAWYEVATWHECLTHDSWWYCLRVLGR